MVSGARRQQTFSRRWQLGGRQVGREGRSMDWIDGLRRHRSGTARRGAYPCAPADGRVAVDSEHDCCRARRAPRADSGNVVRLSAAARSGQKAGGSSGTRGPVAARRDEGDAEAGLGQAADRSGWRGPIVKRDILEMKQELDESTARAFTRYASRHGRVGQACCLSPVLTNTTQRAPIGNAQWKGVQRQAGSLSYAGI